jgi:A-kinase anchor protein 14
MPPHRSRTAAENYFDVLEEELPGVVLLPGVVVVLPAVPEFSVLPALPALPVVPPVAPLVPAAELLPVPLALGSALLLALPLGAVVVELGLSVLLVLGAVEPAAPVEPVDPAVPLVPPVLPVAPELLLVLPAPVSEGALASFLLHAPSARVATRAASNTEYFISVPLKKI